MRRLARQGRLVAGFGSLLRNDARSVFCGPPQLVDDARAARDAATVPLQASLLASGEHQRCGRDAETGHGRCGDDHARIHDAMVVAMGQLAVAARRVSTRVRNDGFARR